MKITQIAINNFRLLEEVKLHLEDGATVIVGRNNSGKTSLTELFRHLLDDRAPKFKLEDFSLGVHEQFWDAYELYKNGEEETEVRTILPKIETILSIEYTENEDLGPLADFIIDLDETCTSTQINIIYALSAGKIKQLFEDLENNRDSFFKALRERIPKLFEVIIEAQDPNDSTNQKTLEIGNLQKLLQFGFVNAQRTLGDDVSNKEKAVLGQFIERLFIATASDTGTLNNQTVAVALKTAVNDIQNHIDTDFNLQLKNLFPAFELFGYPGLTDPQLCTETVLKVEQLLSNHTTVGYLGKNGINLPESYNGLGARNLIFILLKLFELFIEFANRQPNSGIHLVFIEEPEAHLHPQMQSVFIRKLEEIRNLFATRYNEGNPWPVQFVVTTHSSHIANEATFDSMRYFLTQERKEGSDILKTDIKDLHTGLSDEDQTNRDFLHKYMTLTRCDLLFADRAILIEGATERLLLPEMIRKYDDAVDTDSKLGSRYLTIMEVGGAHAHIFFKLLDFLNLRTLIITDLDTTKKLTKPDKNGKSTNTWNKCPVSEGERTSNSCIKSWFEDGSGNPLSCEDILLKTSVEKTKDNCRLAFQIPHNEGDACGRSFEDAFMLANPDKFQIVGTTPAEREIEAWELAKKIDKTEFALEYAIKDTEWETPRYIAECLKWLTVDINDAVDVTEEVVVTAADDGGNSDV